MEKIYKRRCLDHKCKASNVYSIDIIGKHRSGFSIGKSSSNYIFSVRQVLEN